MNAKEPIESANEQLFLKRSAWGIACLLATGLILSAYIPLLPVDTWWVRIGDFPRVQLLVFYLIGIVVILAFYQRRLAKVLAVLLVGGVLTQLYWIFPYLPVAPHQVQAAKSSDSDARLRILSANVLQDNEDADALLRLIASEQPDVVVLLEINSRWVNDLTVLDDSFEFQVLHPLENKYGIAIYSKFPIERSKVRAFVKESIPSIDGVIRLRSGHPVRLLAVHPNPPRPGEDTTKRDAELVLVGREVKDGESTVVLGDMNDVGWSRTTDLFQEVSGLLDPRKGRGLYPTFNARSSIWRYPLDHLFHSDDFRVAEIRTLPPIGSDHFPLLVEISHEPAAKLTQEGPQLDVGDQEDAQDAVEAVRDPEALKEPE
ncbi:endonuclease/exonuclease/phosphatase family protein [Rubripirellula reticaptiva]|nr:endonuclease/exonuclease/phosphatase family protein [Rubripirellula reticaptiva]